MRQHVAAVHRQAVLVHVHDVDVLGEVGEVDGALPVAAHQVQALAGAGAGAAPAALLWYSASNSIRPW